MEHYLGNNTATAREPYIAEHPSASPLACDDGPAPIWEPGCSRPVPRPRPRRIIANARLRDQHLRTCAGIFQAALRRAAEVVSGRGARTARRILEALARAIETRQQADLRGTARAVCLALGVDVCDRAAREAVALLAVHLPFVATGDRHIPCSIRLRSAWEHGAAYLEAHVAPRDRECSDPLGAILGGFLARQLTLDVEGTRAPGDVRESSQDTCDPGPSELDLLGIAPQPGPPATSRQVDHLRRRGLRAPERLTRPEAAAAQRRLWARRRMAAEGLRVELHELRRFCPAEPTAHGDFELEDLRIMSREQMSTLARRLWRLGLEASSPLRDRAVALFLAPMNAHELGASNPPDELPRTSRAGDFRVVTSLRVGECRSGDCDRQSGDQRETAREVPRTLAGPSAGWRSADGVVRVKTDLFGPYDRALAVIRRALSRR